MTTYYFAIASQDFLFKEEPVEEILRERTNHYNSLNKPIDFWLIKNPSSINIPEILNINKKIKKPTAAIISHNPKFIEWLKLRLGFVFTGKLDTSSDLLLHYLENITN
jgi:hypothetical protein|uniref:Ycf54 n=1 Tax=Kumanoa mahlacensis TaxID=1196387 RepID=A0A8K1YUD7_9FLOR|nr:Hypothetical protein Ycf54 [Kumanoa mahlacensis]